MVIKPLQLVSRMLGSRSLVIGSRSSLFAPRSPFLAYRLFVPYIFDLGDSRFSHNCILPLLHPWSANDIAYTVFWSIQNDIQESIT